MKAMKLIFIMIMAILSINYWTNDSLKGQSMLMISCLMGLGFCLFYGIWPYLCKKGSNHDKNRTHR